MKVLFLSFLTLLFISCKQEENLIKSTSEKPQTSNIKVSFISIGSGIEKSGTKNLEGLISEFEQNNQLKLIVSIKNWGREGEKDYCIDCSNLSTEKKIELRQFIDNMFHSSKLIRVFSDVLCD